MRRLPVLLLLIPILGLSGCAGGTNYPDRATAIGPIGKGPAAVWLFLPAGKPKDLVIFFHGQGDFREATPAHHRPWIDHLVARGSAVVYPRWELTYEIDPMPYVVAGVRTAMKRLDAHGLPVLAIGYSRGGGLVVEYGAVAARNHLPVPNAIMSVFPAGQGNERRLVNLAPLDHATRLLIQIGEDDTVVDGAGARFLLRRLQAAGFPGTNIQLDVVRSQQGLTADHFAPLQTSAAARAEFWAVAERMLDDLDRSYGRL